MTAELLVEAGEVLARLAGSRDGNTLQRRAEAQVAYLHCREPE